jgi:hypothetical protein
MLSLLCRQVVFWSVVVLCSLGALVYPNTVVFAQSHQCAEITLVDGNPISADAVLAPGEMIVVDGVEVELPEEYKIQNSECRSQENLRHSGQTKSLDPESSPGGRSGGNDQEAGTNNQTNDQIINLPPSQGWVPSLQDEETTPQIRNSKIETKTPPGLQPVPLGRGEEITQCPQPVQVDISQLDYEQRMV